MNMKVNIVQVFALGRTHCSFQLYWKKSRHEIIDIQSTTHFQKIGETKMSIFGIRRTSISTAALKGVAERETLIMKLHLTKIYLPAAPTLQPYSLETSLPKSFLKASMDRCAFMSFHFHKGSFQECKTKDKFQKTLLIF